MSALQPDQQSRSARLLAILNQTFQRFARANMILQAYTEGVGHDSQVSAFRNSSGLEALRLLSKEFSLRNRAEAAYFRSQLMGKTFAMHISIAAAIRSRDVEECPSSAL